MLPTVVLEGEAYALAATVGTTVDLSWIKPPWLYTSEANSRQDAFKRAIKESSRLYTLIILILFKLLPLKLQR